MGRRLLLASPHMSDEGFELEYVHDAFNKNWIAPLGENVNGFEADMAQYIGAEHTVALSAGTAAIHLAMIMLGIPWRKACVYRFRARNMEHGSACAEEGV